MEMENNNAQINFVENGELFKEEDKFKKKTIYIIIFVLLFFMAVGIVSFISFSNCVNTAMPMTGVPHNYCVGSAKVTTFSVSFLFEAFLLFILLSFTNKDQRVLNLLRATILAFYLSLIFSLGISIFILGGILGLGFANRVLDSGPLKSTLIVLGAVVAYYGIIWLLLNFLK
jgi:hypothetical protein